MSIPAKIDQVVNLIAPARDARGRRSSEAINLDGKDVTHKEIVRAFREMSVYATKQLDNMQRGFYELSTPDGELKEMPVKPEIALKAAEIILERAFGKPVTPIITPEAPRTIEVEDLTDEQVSALITVAEIRPKEVETGDWDGGE